MAWGVKIPVVGTTDCTTYFVVQYKKDFETSFKTVSPNPTVSPIIIENLDDCSTYNIRVTRKCCNGQTSNIATVSIVTGGNCLP